MPYKIQKKGKKTQVVNADTGRIMSKNTTMKKGKRQIRAIYANMKPEHRLRHRIGMLEDTILGGKQKMVVNFAKKYLKHQEIHGGGWFDSVTSWVADAANSVGDWNRDAGNTIMSGLNTLNFLDVSQYPVLNLLLRGAVAEAETDPVGAITGVLQADARELDKLEEEHPWITLALEVIAPELIPFIEGIRVAGTYLSPEEKEQVEEHLVEKMDEAVEIIQEEEVFDPKDFNHINPEERVVDRPWENKNVHGTPLLLDDALRFPMTYNYDENNKPLYLNDYLLRTGVSGINFQKNEFNNIVENQKPYAFLDFPINGGRLGKIDYSRRCY